MRLLLVLLLVAAGMALVFWPGQPGASGPTGGHRRTDPPPPSRPRRVLIDRILIVCEGNKHALHADDIARPREAARRLAERLLRRLRMGADWATIKREYTNDRHVETYEPLGPYIVCDIGTQPRNRRDGIPELPRASMARAFGDLVFGLAVGEIDIAAYGPGDRTQGYDIIKRLG